MKGKSLLRACLTFHVDRSRNLVHFKIDWSFQVGQPLRNLPLVLDSAIKRYQASCLFWVHSFRHMPMHGCVNIMKPHIVGCPICVNLRKRHYVVPSVFNNWIKIFMATVVSILNAELFKWSKTGQMGHYKDQNLVIKRGKDTSQYNDYSLCSKPMCLSYNVFISYCIYKYISTLTSRRMLIL